MKSHDKASLSHRVPLSEMLLAPIAVALAMFFIPSVIELWRWRHGFSLQATIVASNALIGVLSGSLFLSQLLSARRRRAVLLKRLEVISEMNHHVRNALETIEMAASISAAKGDPQQKALLEIIHQSTARIARALSEILGDRLGRD